MKHNKILSKVVYFLICIFFFNVSISISQNTNELLRLGKIDYENQDYARAVNQFNFIDNISPYAITTEQYYWYAKALFHESRLNYFKCIKLLNGAIRKDPEYSKAYFLRGRIKQFLEGTTPVVIEDYKKAYKFSKDGFKNDIFLKSISLSFLKNSEAGIYFLQDIIDFEESKQNHKLLGECYYALAVIYAQEENLLQSLFWLNSALVNNVKPREFMFIDFYNLRESEGFLILMKNSNVPPSCYDIENIDGLNDAISLGEVGFKKVAIIRRSVERKINIWQKKGKFEKTVTYQKRVNDETRKQKIRYYTQKAVDSIGYSMIRWDNISNEYDADNESFKITINEFMPFYLVVPLSDAPSFDTNFDSLEYEQIKFVLLDDYSTEISHIEITNLNIGKTYVYNNFDTVLFNPTEFAFNFDDLEVPIEGLSKSSTMDNKGNTTRVINVGKSDVDANIPVTSISNKNTYALIIGNEDYTKYQNDLNSEVNVDYAKRDAEVFAEYAEKTLGIPKGNITILTDAIGSQMNREIEKLSKLAKYSNGNATLLFYFAGHGFPDEKTKEAYIMPVDISGTNVKSGVKLSALYSKLTEFPTKKSIVILDACFSGGGRNEGLLAARSVAIKPKENPISGNLLIFSSSSGQQSSLPYDNKKHGMFTYFLLKKLKESKGDVSMEELKDYVTREVQINAVKINNKEQNPKLQVSPNLENVWMDWKLR